MAEAVANRLRARRRRAPSRARRRRASAPEHPPAVPPATAAAAAPPARPALFALGARRRRLPDLPGGRPRCRGSTASVWCRIRAKTLAGGAIAPFASPSGRRSQAKACASARAPGTRWTSRSELAADRRERGDPRRRRRRWKGVEDDTLAEAERKRATRCRTVCASRATALRHPPRLRRRAARARGAGLRVDGRATSRALPARRSASSRRGGGALELPARTSQARVGRLLADLRVRAGTAVAVGLDYISLERSTRTLSGGEAQRIQLAAALGRCSPPRSTCSTSRRPRLHARDVAKLVGILHSIRDHGNTVVVVEHAKEVIAAADHVIELGPGAGRLGGRVVAEGDVASLRADPRSPTGRALAASSARARGRRGRGRGSCGSSAHAHTTCTTSRSRSRSASWWSSRGCRERASRRWWARCWWGT